MKCDICERGCIIPIGKTGACGRYINNGQALEELYPNEYLLCCPISIETMPILNFYPRNKFLQISTTGCNFNCPGCVSNIIAKELNRECGALKKLSSNEVVNKALEKNCVGITFIMNDPLASFLTFLEVAKEAKKHGLLVGCSSNAYFTEESLKKISKYLDFIDIGFKGLTDDAYISCGGISFKPVLRNIRLFHECGVHVEVACIHKKNNTNEILEIAKKIKEISINIPLQIMRFIPLEDASPELEPSIKDSEKLVQELKHTLNYVYLFNSPGTDLLDTNCPNCGELIIKRDFYGPMGSKLKWAIGSNHIDTCPKCGNKLNIKGNLSQNTYKEEDFKGGYPFTRALEMVEAILIAINVNDRKSLMECWEYLLQGDNLKKLHHNVQEPEAYFNTIRFLGSLVKAEDNAEKLITYLKEKLTLIKEGLLKTEKRPRVYYAMGKPLFCIKGERLENQLINIAGGISVNNEIDCSGRPGMKISSEELTKLNPDFIFISSFLSSSTEDFYYFCQQLSINVEAVKNKKIYNHTAPNFDFGSPRWILGLMYVANILHPEVFNFDIDKEANIFYKEFYGINYVKSDINRSFAKPSSKWIWS